MTRRAVQRCAGPRSATLRGVGPVGIALAACLGLLASGCAASRSFVYTPDELRQEIRRRVPDLDREKIAVPHEIPAGALEAAERAMPRSRRSEIRLEALMEALADPRRFGLRYDWSVTDTAARTLETRAGNCMSLASVVVGMARKLGLRAYYAKALRRDRDPEQVGNTRIWSGHMAAEIYTRSGRTFLDFSGRMGPEARYLRIDDVEAVAHFYNNRGYELMLNARRRGEPVPFEAVRRHFEIATRIAPEFAQAWNNLGVALSRLGERSAAQRMYHTALENDPGLQAARMNLEQLGFSPDRPAPARRQ
ncbi:MAG: hypothetical protein J4G09_13500 [Proteobacteria bacterium]|nr:hypothetical protein [Pseudomonadota bacterium]